MSMPLHATTPISIKATEVSDGKFYHSMDLPGIGEVVGEWDLRGKVDSYLGNEDFQGRSVLDVGTGSGFLTFEIEKRGAASVVSVEADSVRRIQLLPFLSHPIISDYEGWVQIGEAWLNMQKASYWIAHRAFGSKALAYYGDVYDLPAALGKFDTVVVAQILVHLRDPIAALTSMASRCKDTLIIVEGMINDPKPMAEYLPIDAISPASIWWKYSEGLYAQVLKLLGFEIVKRTVDGYRCVVHNTDVAVTTLVCKRARPA